MLNHTKIVMAFLLILIIIIGLNAPPYFYFILIAAFLLSEFYGAAFIQSNFHLKAFSKIHTSEKVVALTFDDGPGPYTSDVLNVLGENGITATFFLIGKHINGKEAVVKRIFKEGHVIGNHSHDHNFWFDLRTRKVLEADLKMAETEIYALTGTRPLYFRPPFGVTTPALSYVVKKLGYTVIGWNVRSFDTTHKDPVKALVRIQNKLVPGSIILLHDSLRGSDLLLKELLKYLTKQQYRVVGLEELIQMQTHV